MKKLNAKKWCGALVALLASVSAQAWTPGNDFDPETNTQYVRYDMEKGAFMEGDMAIPAANETFTFAIKADESDAELIKFLDSSEGDVINTLMVNMYAEEWVGLPLKLLPISQEEHIYGVDLNFALLEDQNDGRKFAMPEGGNVYFMVADTQIGGSDVHWTNLAQCAMRLNANTETEPLYFETTEDEIARLSAEKNIVGGFAAPGEALKRGKVSIPERISLDFDFYDPETDLWDVFYNTATGRIDGNPVYNETFTFALKVDERDTQTIAWLDSDPENNRLVVNLWEGTEMMSKEGIRLTRLPGEGHVYGAQVNLEELAIELNDDGEDPVYLVFGFVFAANETVWNYNANTHITFPMLTERKETPQEEGVRYADFLEYEAISETEATVTGHRTWVEDENGERVAWSENARYRQPENGLLEIPETVDIDGTTYTVTTIGWRALADGGMSDVYLPQSVKTIETGAWAGCTGLEVAYFLDGTNVETLGADVFGGCRNLRALIIPESVTQIGEDGRTSICNSCNALRDIVVREGNPVYDSRNGSNAIIETATGKLIQGSGATRIPEGVTELGYQAFYGVPWTRMDLPESLELIGRGALDVYDPDGEVKSIVIPAGVKTIGDYAWSNNGNVTVELQGVTPPVIGEFFDKDADGVYYIPAGAMKAYREAWGRTYDFRQRMVQVEASAADNGGSVSGSDVYKSGASVTLTATPNEGYVFGKWSNGETAEEIVIVPTEDTEVSASFVRAYRVNATSVDPKAGTVSLTGTVPVKAGGTVTLRAVPAEHAVFDGWSDGNTDNPRRLTPTDDITLTANFHFEYVIAATANSTAGSVEGAGTYALGERVTLKAVANEGFEFMCWYDVDTPDDYGNTDPEMAFVVTEDKHLTAFFTIAPEGVEELFDEPIEDVTVLPDTDNALVVMPRVEEAVSYSLDIMYEGKLILTITIDEIGRLTGFDFHGIMPMGATSTTVTAGPLAFTATGLAPGTTYDFSIGAYDGEKGSGNKIFEETGTFRTLSETGEGVKEVRQLEGISTDGNTLVVKGHEGETMRVGTVLGHVVYEGKAQSVSLEKGVYGVRIGNRSMKILIP